MRQWIWLAFFFLIPATAGAIEAKVDIYDKSKSYGVIIDTANVVFCEKCERSKLEPYEWKTWEGYYSIRAFMQAIADIKVQREPADAVLSDATPFIDLAVAEAMKMGGSVVCYVKIKRNKQMLGFDSITFRVFRQFFQAGNANLAAFFDERSNKGILMTLGDVREYQKK